MTPQDDASTQGRGAGAPGAGEASVPPMVAKGIAHFNAQRYREAVDSFCAALRADPGSPQAGYLLAHALHCADLPPAKKRRARSLLKQVPCHDARAAGPDRATEAQALAVLLDARASLRRGRLEEACRGAEESLGLSRSADVIESLLGLPEPPGEVPDARSAVKLLRRLAAFAEARPKSPWPPLMQAHLHYRLGRAAEALRATEGMPRLPPRYGWMRFLRGKIQLHFFCAYRRAQQEFRAALHSAPAYWNARAHLAEATLCRGDRRALILLGEMVEGLSGPHRANALAWRGEVLLWLGAYAEAFTDLDTAVQGGAPFARCWRGGALLLLGDPEGAAADLDEALRLSPLDPEALVWRAETKRRLGRPDEAVLDATAAMRARDSHFWAVMNRALARAEMGDLPGLRDDFKLIRPDVARFLLTRSRLPVEGPKRDGELLSALKEGLRAGRGVRTPQPYLFPLWLRRTPLRLGA